MDERPEKLSSVSSEPSDQKPQKKSIWGRVVRLSLLVVGAIALFTIVRSIGARTVLNTLLSVGAYLPLILLLDIGWLAVESLGARALYAERMAQIPRGRFAYTVLVHYVTFLLVPMGRASAEVTRAALLGPHIGKQRAVVSAALMQSFALVGNAVFCLLSLICVFFVAPKSALVAALATTIAVSLGLGVTTYLVMRHVRLGGFLGRRFSKLQNAGPEFDAEFRATTKSHKTALFFCLVSRVLQTAQYGVILLAVSGKLTAVGPLIAEGIQLVARSAGDMIPNQVGVTEGAFALFKGPLGFEKNTALAVSVALVARVSNLTMAGATSLVIQFWPSRSHSLSSELSIK